MKKLRCAILDDYQDISTKIADWTPLREQVEVVVFCEHFSQQEALVAAVADCEVIVIMRERTPFPKALFAKLPRLRLLVTTGMRNASIDVAAAVAHGVTVCGTASSSEPPAELTWALLLALARDVVGENVAFRRSGPWQSSVGFDLQGKRLGLLGLGKIGSKVAKVGAAFGMDVVAWSPNLTDARASEVGVTRAASKEALLETSDFVSIHLVLGERSRGVIGRAEFERMRPTAFLINTSRAQIVDQAALVEALQRGMIAGAAVDVFEVEPVPEGDVLRTLPTLLATPHLGYVSRNNYATYFREAVEDIQAFLAGAPIRKLS
ncbi:D-2-hydroxyacid dehydrogenase family protein [Corallococcus llansteffanensis]|uniref:D-2-hydroxyacid dehydrogenase family protein n=1 Tax=Corallococcus llansteffanensis TaxID=2316731 RepID=A0A3A8QC17_9BACT|nr:D-2-hydroxyacid dehydrogenase family protein [Corallococcus llansteffanensis]RKH66156.1 D-2-hydroxyacid dehydrogenase family protein [Corallococcus llansteffanensis]